MSTPADRLNEFLTEETDRGDLFTVDSKEKAIWAFRKLKQLENKRQEVIEVAQREIDRITLWRDGDLGYIENDMDYFRGALTEYHRSEFTKDDNVKSIKFKGFGNLKSKAQQPEVTYSEESVKGWARKNAPEFIVFPPPPEPKLAWGELKKKLDFKTGQAVYKETGEIVPDITVTERERKFEVEVE